MTKLSKRALNLLIALTKRMKMSRSVPSHKEKKKRIHSRPHHLHHTLLASQQFKHQPDILASVAHDAIVPGTALAKG